MKKYLGVMALGLGLALVGATASFAQVTGGPVGAGGPGNGTAATPSGMNSKNGTMNNPGHSGMSDGAPQNMQKKDMSPASPDAGARQDR